MLGLSEYLLDLEVCCLKLHEQTLGDCVFVQGYLVIGLFANRYISSLCYVVLIVIDKVALILACAWFCYDVHTL